MQTGQQCLRWLCDCIIYFIGQQLLLNNVQVYLQHSRSRFCISRVIAYSVLNFVATGTRVSRGRICLTSFNTTNRKTRVIRKDIGDIKDELWPILSLISLPWQRWLVAVKFVWRQSRARPRKHRYSQRSRGYLLHRPSYGRFCPKFRCHGNGGWSQQNFSGVIQ